MRELVMDVYEHTSGVIALHACISLSASASPSLPLPLPLCLSLSLSVSPSPSSTSQSLTQSICQQMCNTFYHQTPSLTLSLTYTHTQMCVHTFRQQTLSRAEQFPRRCCRLRSRRGDTPQARRSGNALVRALVYGMNGATPQALVMVLTWDLA